MSYIATILFLLFNWRGANLASSRLSRLRVPSANELRVADLLTIGGLARTFTLILSDLWLLLRLVAACSCGPL